MTLNNPSTMNDEEEERLDEASSLAEKRNFEDDIYEQQN